jgi:hypothetical protein
MADVPAYTTVPGRIPELLTKVRQVGVPDKVTHEWLRSIGLRSSNDRSLVGVLQQIGFIDASKSPHPSLAPVPRQGSSKVLGRAVREGYSDLYAMFPEAHAQDAQTLSHWFSEKSNAGQQAVSKSVSTFKKLSAEAEFNGLEGDHQASEPDAEASQQPDSSALSPTTVTSTTARRGGGEGVTINVNVQLTLPETANSAVFDSFFKSMREHLLSDEA